MDMNEFKAQLEECNWKQCLMAIIFDNAMVWQFNQRRRVYNETTHKWEYGEWIPPEESLVFCDDGVSIKFKEVLPMKDMTNPLYNKAYYWTIRHVENIQAIVACDLDNKELRPFFDGSIL